MNKNLSLSNGNSISIEIDDRKAKSQAFVEEFAANGDLLLTTTFTLRKGYREADSRRDFEAMSDEAVEALNSLGEGRFILP